MVKKYKLRSNIAGYKSGETVEWHEDMPVFTPINKLLELGLIEEVDPYKEFIQEIVGIAIKYDVHVYDTILYQSIQINDKFYSSRLFICDIAEELKKESK